MSRSFENWIITFIDEKGIDRQQTFEVEGPSGMNFIPLGVVIEFVLMCGDEVQAQVKDKLVHIDFVNGDPVHFFKFLAKGMGR